ncbi:MAG: hypothetical protein F4137_18075 [Acidobacteria bacterium]|nr:hypothetical protein [Acidobacteriota bacterium]
MARSPKRRRRRATGARDPAEGPLAVEWYVARNEDGAVVGRAYIDTHTPKTERQSLLISLDTVGRIKGVDVTVFFEPAQYMAPQDWLRQFDGEVLHDELAIRRIAGSSFTGRAISNAVRRVLALDQVLQAGAAQP